LTVGKGTVWDRIPPARISDHGGLGIPRSGRPLRRGGHASGDRQGGWWRRRRRRTTAESGVRPSRPSTTRQLGRGVGAAALAASKSRSD